jgi:Flp pilus assembly protein protease CpaA
MALLIGHHKLISFLFLMSAFGGVLGLAVLARDKLAPRLARLGFALAGRVVPKVVRPVQRDSTVPYGLAIAAAGVITLIIAR